MRLTRIRIKNYRSIYDNGEVEFALLKLSPRGNYLVGPNNVGKSNIIRALQLALRPQGRRAYDPDIDIPKQKQWAYPTVTLDFEMERKRGPYKTLLRYASEYEQSVQGADPVTFAQQGLVRFHVQHTTEAESRQELLLANGAGSRKGDHDLLNRALSQFHDVVRLVDIESGENLESLLQRGFKELFATVLSEKFREEIDDAQGHRDSYEDHLREEVLGPVAEHITEHLPQHVPGVEGVELHPGLESVEEALAAVDIRMDDTVDTPLAFKGTGVRGALIQMFMSFIADATRRSVVFAIEEPEAFLHPEGHASLGRQLESFTNRSDISLVVTTHSPFILSRDSEAAVFTVAKTPKGQTVLHREPEPEQAVRSARRLLTGSDSVPTAMDLIDSVPDDAKAILVVEGPTDAIYLETAADRATEENLLEGIHIVVSEGAKEIVKDATVLKTIFEGEKAVYILLDDDGVGADAYSVLTGNLKFQGTQEVAKYSKWRPKHGRPVEAEDLFPHEQVKEWADALGDAIEGSGERRDGTWRYELRSSAKWPFAQAVQGEATLSDCEVWIKMIHDIRDHVGLPAVKTSQ